MHAPIIEDVLRGFGFETFDIALSPDAAIATAAGHCPDLITARSVAAGVQHQNRARN